MIKMWTMVVVRNKAFDMNNNPAKNLSNSNEQDANWLFYYRK